MSTGLGTQDGMKTMRTFVGYKKGTFTVETRVGGRLQRGTYKPANTKEGRASIMTHLATVGKTVYPKEGTNLEKTEKYLNLITQGQGPRLCERSQAQQF